MRLLDRRFAGVARGVGTAVVLGRVHSAQLKLDDLHLACAFTIMEGRDVDLLFGLDMLKAHQACIDLEKNVLRIRGREVRFLAEHELPEKAKLWEQPQKNAPGNELSSAGAGPSGPVQPREQHFPGAGATLGAAPRRDARPPPAQANRYPETSLQTLMNLGASRDDAIRALDAAGGNVEYAASMLFSF